MNEMWIFILLNRLPLTINRHQLFSGYFEGTEVSSVNNTQVLHFPINIYNGSILIELFFYA